MNTFNVVMEAVLLIAYAIGVLIIIKFQNNKISILRTEIDSQSGIMKKTEQFMNIFKLDMVDKYVEIMQKKTQVEKDEAIKKIEEEWKHKAKQGYEFVLTEYLGLFSFSLNLIDFMPKNNVLIKALNEMPDSFAKKELTSRREKTEQEIDKIIERFSRDNSFAATLIQLLPRTIFSGYPLKDSMKSNEMEVPKPHK